MFWLVDFSSAIYCMLIVSAQCDYFVGTDNKVYFLEISTRDLSASGDCYS